MVLIINGEKKELPGVDAAATVSALITHLGLAKAACAVELNSKLVPKKDHSSRTLQDGDRVEIVTLVGGG